MAAVKKVDPPQPTRSEMVAAGCVDGSWPESMFVYSEAHEAHMALNGDCPWCGAYDKGKWR
jgi:hypothetical protein